MGHENPMGRDDRGGGPVAVLLPFPVVLASPPNSPPNPHPSPRPTPLTRTKTQPNPTLPTTCFPAIPYSHALPHPLSPNTTPHPPTHTHTQAKDALATIEGRLSGTLIGVACQPSLPLSAEGHASRLISEACDKENLGRMYIWWVPVCLFANIWAEFWAIFKAF